MNIVYFNSTQNFLRRKNFEDISKSLKRLTFSHRNTHTENHITQFKESRDDSTFTY